MRVLVAIAFLAPVHAQPDGQFNDMQERMQALMADPRFHEQAQLLAQPLAQQMAQPLEAMMAESDQIKTALRDPSFQKEAKRVIEPITALMEDPRLQKEAKQAAEQMQAVMLDPSFQEEAKRIAQPLLAMAENPDPREAERVLQHIQTMMADPKFEKLAKRVAEPMVELMSDENFKQDVQTAFEQVQAVMADPKFQTHAKRVAEPALAMMAEAKQMQEVMASPSFQREAERVGEQMQALVQQVSPQRKSLASLLLAANPPLAARSGVATAKPLQRARVVMSEDIEEKLKGIIAEQLGVDAEKVTPAASFTEDLGADSLDAVELIMAIEEAFDIEIPDEEAEKMTTPGDCVTAIKGKL